MTDDDLVRRLLVGACAQNDVAWSLMRAAADRIEALTAEREELVEYNEQFSVDNQFLKKRAEKAEAGNARLREALEQSACKCSSNCDWERDDICPSWIARAALNTGKEAK